jgi:hypothetical protein
MHDAAGNQPGDNCFFPFFVLNCTYGGIYGITEDVIVTIIFRLLRLSPAVPGHGGNECGEGF